MTQAKIRFQSFEEYLSYDDGTENLYNRGAARVWF